MLAVGRRPPARGHTWSSAAPANTVLKKRRNLDLLQVPSSLCDLLTQQRENIPSEPATSLRGGMRLRRAPSIPDYREPEQACCNSHNTSEGNEQLVPLQGSSRLGEGGWPQTSAGGRGESLGGLKGREERPSQQTAPGPGTHPSGGSPCPTFALLGWLLVLLSLRGRLPLRWERPMVGAGAAAALLLLPLAPKPAESPAQAGGARLGLLLLWGPLRGRHVPFFLPTSGEPGARSRRRCLLRAPPGHLRAGEDGSEKAPLHRESSPWLRSARGSHRRTRAPHPGWGEAPPLPVSRAPRRSPLSRAPQLPPLDSWQPGSRLSPAPRAPGPPHLPRDSPRALAPHVPPGLFSCSGSALRPAAPGAKEAAGESFSRAGGRVWGGRGQPSALGCGEALPPAPHSASPAARPGAPRTLRAGRPGAGPGLDGPSRPAARGRAAAGRSRRRPGANRLVGLAGGGPRGAASGRERG